MEKRMVVEADTFFVFFSIIPRSIATVTMYFDGTVFLGHKQIIPLTFTFDVVKYIGPCTYWH
jgi:hypothetical protein